MRERRQHARYDVSRFSNLWAGTHHGPVGERLMTMSIGGCGFWSPLEDFNLQIGEKIKLQFRWGEKPGKTADLKGEILYITPHPFEGQIGRFYGIRFENQQPALVSEIMAGLDQLYQQGKLKMA